MADNLRTISQRTGEFIDDESSEPGFAVNMDDEGAQAFIDKIKGANQGSAAPAVTESEPVNFPAAATGSPATATSAAPAATETQTAEPVAQPVQARAQQTATQVRTATKGRGTASRGRK